METVVAQAGNNGSAASVPDRDVEVRISRDGAISVRGGDVLRTKAGRRSLNEAVKISKSLGLRRVK